MQEWRDIRTFPYLSTNPNGCIYSYNIKYACWNSNRAIQIQTGPLDQDLECPDLFLITSVNQTFSADRTFFSKMIITSLLLGLFPHRLQCWKLYFWGYIRNSIFGLVKPDIIPFEVDPS